MMMSAANFKVILTSPPDNKASIRKIAKTFADRFNLPPKQARQIIDKAPYTLKAETGENIARTYHEILTDMGLGCRIEDMNGVEVDVSQLNDAVQAPVPVAAPVEAPKPVPVAAPVEAPPPAAKIPEVEEDQPGLKFKIEGRPDYAFATVQLPANKTLKVEASAMATMDTNINMKTKMRGGLGRLISGESIFINEFTAEGAPGEIGIAPGTPGDMGHLYLDDNCVFLQNSAFVAADMDVNIETKWQGLTKGFFSGESFFLIRCSGKGDLWFNTYGAIHEIDVSGEYVVDTGNIVAFTDGLEYKITKVGGYKSLFFSGEGFVCRFSGQGKVWLQTRGVQAFVSWAHVFRPVKRRG